MAGFQRIAVDKLIGSNSANNTADTSAVAANADGSMLERLEYLQQLSGAQAGVAGVSPMLGTRVNKSAANLPATTTQNIFTVTGGRVLVTLLYGQVTTVIQAQSCNLKVTSAPTTGTAVDLAANLDINAKEAGTLLGVEGDGTALIGANAGAFLNAIGRTAIVVPIGSIRIETSATNTGATSWQLWYVPLDSGAAVASA